MKPITLGEIATVVSARLRLASALAAIGVVYCISPPGAEADALPPGYPAYIPVDQYYASQGLGLISATVVFDEVITGNDNNGGYVLRETTWGTVYSEPSPFSINDGGYTANGYESAGLPISLQPGTTTNLPTQFPAELPPPVKTPEQKLTWALEIAFIAALAPEIEVLGASAELLGAADGIQSGLLGLLADPVDLNYTQIVTPAAPPVIPPPNFAGMTPAEIAAWTDLTSAIADMSVLPDAIQTSVDRAEGAFQSGAPQFWVDLQSEAFNKYDQLDNADFARVQTDANILGLNASAAPVPEPGTLTLLGSALLALLLVGPLHLVFLRRRR